MHAMMQSVLDEGASEMRVMPHAILSSVIDFFSYCSVRLHTVNTMYIMGLMKPEPVFFIQPVFCGMAAAGSIATIFVIICKCVEYFHIRVVITNIVNQNACALCR